MKLEDIVIAEWYIVESNNSRKPRQVLHKGPGYVLVSGGDSSFIRIDPQDVVSPARIVE